jgi:hypothetical protein
MRRLAFRRCFTRTVPCVAAADKNGVLQFDYDNAGDRLVGGGGGIVTDVNRLFGTGDMNQYGTGPITGYVRGNKRPSAARRLAQQIRRRRRRCFSISGTKIHR